MSIASFWNAQTP